MNTGTGLESSFHLDSEDVKEDFKSDKTNIDTSLSFSSGLKEEAESHDDINEKRSNNNPWSESFSIHQSLSYKSARDRELSSLINAMTDYILMNFNGNLETLENLYQTCLSLSLLKNLQNVQTVLQLRKGRIQCLNCQKFKDIHEIKDIWCNKSSCKICIDCRIKVRDFCSGCRRLYSDNEKLQMKLRNC